MLINQDFPKISIITASFNSEKTISDAIQSVLSQLYPNYEYIIIDGGSKDNTVEIIKSFEPLLGNKLKWISEKDTGIYDAWNKGLRLAEGEWVCFIGSDDVLMPDALLQYVDALSYNPNVNFISSRVELVDANLQHLKYFGEKLSNKMKRYNCIAHVGSLHKMSLYKEFGEFSTVYKICGDYDFLLRNHNHINAAFIDIITARMRCGGVSNSSPYSAFKETLAIKNRYCNDRLTNYLFFLKTCFGYKIKKIINNKFVR